jgi:hypothetical protein
MLVSKALAIKVSAAVATAGLALSGAAVANAATTHAHHSRIPTRMFIQAGPGHFRTHRYPHTVAWIQGHLTTATRPSFDVHGVRVLLERDFNGRWVVTQHKETFRYGWVTFRVRALRHGASFKLVFTGNRFFRPTASDIITIAPVK